MRTLNRLAGSGARASYMQEAPEVDVPVLTPSEVRLSTVLDSVEVVVPEGMTALMRVTVDARLGSYARVRLGPTAYPRALQAAPLVLSVVEVHRSEDREPVASITGGHAFSVPRTGFAPWAQRNGMWPNDTTQAGEVTIARPEGRYVVSLSLLCGPAGPAGPTGPAGPPGPSGPAGPAGWMAALVDARGDSGWVVPGYAAPFADLALEEPRVLQVQTDMFYADPTPHTRPINPPPVARHYLCADGRCVEQPAGPNLAECLLECGDWDLVL